MSENNVVAFTPRARRQARRRKTVVPRGTLLAALISSWELALANKAPTTRTLYLRVARRFVDFLQAEGPPDDAETVTAEEVRMFLDHERKRAGDVWFAWIIPDGERTTFSRFESGRELSCMTIMA
ncbi:hypothetical protein ABT294_44505 [Nonomuraea sp. NPDC000554]|uniref:hypothetical protein n=1 Tax=Nonomuraea sp. NPDC000554 TaxID=3154259 RepID=UPI003327394E